MITVSFSPLLHSLFEGFFFLSNAFGLGCINIFRAFFFFFLIVGEKMNVRRGIMEQKEEKQKKKKESSLKKNSAMCNIDV